MTRTAKHVAAVEEGGWTMTQQNIRTTPERRAAARAAVGSEWINTRQQLPPEGVEVETMDSGGHVQSLTYKSGLWFFPDMSMYVYYVPQAWRQVVKR